MIVLILLQFGKHFFTLKRKKPCGNLYVYWYIFVVMMQKFKLVLEKHAFGVCTRLGQVMGISTCSIRLFFIYASFLTFGSPIIVYLSLAFLLNMRKHLRRNNHPTVWNF